MSRKKFSFSLLADHVYLSLLSALALFPLLWVLLCSVKSKQELMDRPTALLPHYISWDSYRHILGQMGFVTNILNSLWVALAATAATIFISALGAYGIVRFCPRLGKKLTRLMIMSYMFPSILLAVPYYDDAGRAYQYPPGARNRIPVVLRALRHLAAGGLFWNRTAGN